ncbi:hypothetical protein [Haloarchaeobius sp. TZWWS8]|uniref:hypothetical protein n=1 Tax=Haloarchaeobius sp. TZWWS8 TaxID=3446121 RepID=UPI003EBD6786
MKRRRFLRSASGLGSCVALAGCLEFGEEPPDTSGPADLLVTSIVARPSENDVTLSVGIYLDRTEPVALEVEGEVVVDESTVRERRTVQLSGERSRLTLQLLFPDVVEYPSVPEQVDARARVGYDGELSAWYETGV